MLHVLKFEIYIQSSIGKSQVIEKNNITSGMTSLKAELIAIKKLNFYELSSNST